MKNNVIRYIMALAMLTTSLFAMGCSEKNNINESPQTSNPTKMPENTGNAADAQSEKIMREYADRYGATKIFQDACVPQKYLLCNEESVVYLFAIEGATECTVISLEAIEKYKRFDIGNLIQFTIFNRTASEISFFARSEDADALEEIIAD